MYLEDDCGIDLLEPYCTSSCPEDCISGRWESSHWEENQETWSFEHAITKDNMLAIECGKS